MKHVRYSVTVKFNKDFVEVDEAAKRITVGVRAKPVKGKANEEVLKKLAKHFDVPSSSVLIVAGARSKDKVVEIL
ncbi:MAG: DUF167 domain-containing protein [Candidatus Aenigmarchaeota archaeon]|nr:DUF167 domain-containing protein [Candidatus Aenigmarchaeota archaeon]